MRIAILAALRSKDPSTPVSYIIVALHVYMYKAGAVIANKDHKIVGIGYNSMPYIEDNDKIFSWKGDEDYEAHRYDVQTKYPFGNIFLTATELLYYSCTCSSQCYC